MHPLMISPPTCFFLCNTKIIQDYRWSHIPILDQQRSDGRADGRTYGRTDGRTDRWIDGQMDGRRHPVRNTRCSKSASRTFALVILILRSSILLRFVTSYFRSFRLEIHRPETKSLNLTYFKPEKACRRELAWQYMTATRWRKYLLIFKDSDTNWFLF